MFVLLVVVMGSESAYFCCYLENKVHLFIAKSCHGIIIVEGWKVLLFDAWSCHGIQSSYFSFLQLLFG
jgi:hypothetical protein